MLSKTSCSINGRVTSLVELFEDFILVAVSPYFVASSYKLKRSDSKTANLNL